MRTSNRIIAKILSEIGTYLEMQDIPFKPRAYEKAAEAVGGLGEDAESIYRDGGLRALEEIPGVGASIAKKIEELVRTGKLAYYDKLRKRTPVDVSGLMKVEGLGAKSIRKLYRKLGIRNLGTLEQAARSGKIAKLPGFGKKSQEKILKGIEFRKRSGERFLLGSVMPEIEEIESRLRGIPGVGQIATAGSVRRRKETIGDVDILIASRMPKEIMNYFTKMPDVVYIHAKGDTKSSVKLRAGLDVDLRIVPRESYGAALNYFTGSKEHNVALRERAVKRGMKLNEYGLFRKTAEREVKVAGESEEGIYKALGLRYIEPELRENSGEIERAERGKLPDLVAYGSLRGDLQVQTDWSDGSASIEAMARAAVARGLEYIAITDHTKGLAMTGGLDEKKILKQMAEIDRVNKKLRGRIKILKSTECDILKDGSLDLPGSVLVKLDIVGVSVHSRFGLSRKDQTERIMRAISNPDVDILFHPTGRIIQRREPYELDINAVVRAAKRSGAILEINAQPARLDLKDEYIRKCVESGVLLSIDSDAHAPGHFAYLPYGIAQARRGWAERRNIVNTWPLKKMLQFLK